MVTPVKPAGLGKQAADDLLARLAELLKLKAAMEHQTAMEVAYIFVDDFLHQWGGVGMYFPSGRQGRLSRRDEEIYRQFTGDNLLHLSRRFNLTTRRISDIVARGKAYDLLDRQGDMFDLPS